MRKKAIDPNKGLKTEPKLTNERLWKKLDKASDIKDIAKRTNEMILLLKQGYEQNLDVLVFGSVMNGDHFHQAYSDTEEGRLMMCYTTKAHAMKEHRRIAEGGLMMCREISIWEMLNNVFNKKSIFGLVFNPEDENMVIIPKMIMEIYMPGEKPFYEFFSESW